MSKALMTEEEFSRAVVTRARRERPDIRVKAMGKFFLMVESEPGRQRVVSLVNPYQAYCGMPLDRDQVIGNFLNTLVYQEPVAVGGSFDQNRHKVMPQVVPSNLLDFCREEGRELITVGYVGDLHIAFVIDEPERYSYIQRKIADEWGAGETVLLTTAMQNLQAMNKEAGCFNRFGTGTRTSLVWETFDGYDASRVLLSRELTNMAVLVSGNPVIAVPHRDYLIMFGDADPDFAAETTERVRAMHDGHSYPISTQLFTLSGGTLDLYAGPDRQQRILN